MLKIENFNTVIFGKSFKRNTIMNADGRCSTDCKIATSMADKTVPSHH